MNIRTFQSYEISLNPYSGYLVSVDFKKGLFISEGGGLPKTERSFSKVNPDVRKLIKRKIKEFDDKQTELF